MISNAIAHFRYENAVDIAREDGIARTATEVKDCRHGDRCTAWDAAIPVPCSPEARQTGRILDEVIHQKLT